MIVNSFDNVKKINTIFSRLYPVPGLVSNISLVSLSKTVLIEKIKKITGVQFIRYCPRRLDVCSLPFRTHENGFISPGDR